MASLVASKDSGTSGLQREISRTSREMFLWDSLSLVVIAIENVDQTSPRKIVASLVGLKDNVLARHLLIYADKVIELMGSSPFGLATITAAINSRIRMSGQRDAIEVHWSDAAAAISKLLRPKIGASRPILFQVQDPGHLWTKMKTTLEHWSEAARNLLYLTTFFEGLPEVVVRMTSNGFAVNEVKIRADYSHYVTSW